MRKVAVLLVLLLVLSLPAAAQEPPTIGVFSPDGMTVEMGTWVDVSASFSDPDGDLWEVALYVIGPLEDMGLRLSYNDHTGQLVADGQSCSPGQNLMTGIINCYDSAVLIDSMTITPTWQVWVTWPPGIYEFKALAVDNDAEITSQVVGTLNVVAATWPYPF